MSDPQTTSGWKACQGGEIARLSETLRHRRHTQVKRRQLMNSAIMVAGLLLCVGLGWAMLQLPLDPEYQIACSEVIEKTEAYKSHQLDEELTARINRHLDHCSGCREHYEHAGIDVSAELSLLGNVARFPVLAAW